MQAVLERELKADHELYSGTKVIQEFATMHIERGDDLNHGEVADDDDYGDYDDEDEVEDEDEEEEEFSFMFEGINSSSSSSIATEDAFANGETMPVFPLFNRDLFFSSEDLKSLQENLPMRVPVKKVFVETDEGDVEGHLVTSAKPGSDEIVGPYCEWSMKKAVEASSTSCKKSNSTGFSRIWRFKDFMGRSNSDGKDAYVFLNNTSDRTSKAEVAAKAIGKEKFEKRSSNNGGIDHGQPPKAETTVKVVGNAMKGGKRTKKAPLSAHEVYLRSKAKEEEKRRSYLPYRPELMGFFTNANVGLTKNVHPF